LGEGSFSKVKLVKRLLDGKLLALKQVKMEKLENK
jgi:serine/threonine protein kinase